MRKFLAHLKDWRNVTVFDNAASLSGVAFYQMPNVTSSIEFVPDILLEWDSWYYVTLNETQIQEMLWPYINNTSGATSTSTINDQNYDEVAALFLIENNAANTNPPKMIVSKVTAWKILQPRKVIVLSVWWAEIVEREKAISFDGYIDAYYDWANKLFFKRFSGIKSLFKNIEVFYKKATEEQKMEFLNNDFFTTTKNRDRFNVWDRNMRRIALVMDQLSAKWIDLSAQSTRDTYVQYANKYRTSWKITINITDWKLEFSTNEDLWEILDVLEENLYTTEITGEPRVSHVNKTI